MPKVTIADLFAKIGQLTMENEALRTENERLTSTVSALIEGDGSDKEAETPDPEKE